MAEIVVGYPTAEQQSRLLKGNAQLSVVGHILGETAYFEAVSGSGGMVTAEIKSMSGVYYTPIPVFPSRLLQFIELSYFEADWSEAECSAREVDLSLDLDAGEAASLRDYSRSGSIYFIQANIGGPIKIGWSANVPNRVESFQLGCPFTLVVLGQIDGAAVSDEKELHRKFADYRLHGEWFTPATELLSFIKENALCT